MTPNVNEFNVSIDSLKTYHKTNGDITRLKTATEKVNGRELQVLVVKNRVVQIITKIWDAIVDTLQLHRLPGSFIEDRKIVYQNRKNEIETALTSSWTCVNAMANYLRAGQKSNVFPENLKLGVGQHYEFLAAWNKARAGCCTDQNLIVWNADAFEYGVNPTSDCLAMGTMVDDRDEPFPTLGHYFSGTPEIKKSIEIRYGMTVDEMSKKLGYDLKQKKLQVSDCSFKALFFSGCYHWIKEEEKTEIFAKMPLSYIMRISPFNEVSIADSLQKLQNRPKDALPVSTPKTKEEFAAMTMGLFALLTPSQLVEVIDVIEPKMLWLIRLALPMNDWMALSEEKLQKLHPQGVNENYPWNSNENLKSLDWMKVSSAQLDRIFRDNYRFNRVVDANILLQIIVRMSDKQLNWLNEFRENLTNADFSKWSDVQLSKLPVCVFSELQMKDLIFRLSDLQVNKLTPEQRKMMSQLARVEQDKLRIKPEDKMFPDLTGTTVPEGLSEELTTKWKLLARYRLGIVEFFPERPAQNYSQPAYSAPRSSGQHNVQHGTPNGTWVSDGINSRFIPASQGGNNVTMVSDGSVTIVNGKVL